MLINGSDTGRVFTMPTGALVTTPCGPALRAAT